MSNFNKISYTLFEEARRNNGMIAMFLVGCFPNKGGNPHHEYPPVLKRLLENFPRCNVCVYLIDPSYKSGYIPQFISNAHYNNGMYKIRNLSTMIYPYEFLNKSFSYDWDRLYELCVNVSHFNCSSIIFNFSGVNEKQFDYHPSIYFPPTNCLGDVENDIQYNPIIEFEDRKPVIFNPKNLNDIEILLKNQIDNNKLNFCYWRLSNLLSYINNTYLKIYTIVSTEKDCKLNDHNLHKNIKHILFRTQGKYETLIEKELYRWTYTQTNSLKTYIEEKLDSYLLTILKIKYKNSYEENLIEIKIGPNNSYYQIMHNIIQLF